MTGGATKLGTIVWERDVDIPMPDGTVLRADVYRSDDPTPRPVLLQLTAYSKAKWASVNGVISPARAVDEGFVVVVADARSRFRSGGDEPFEPFVHDGPDAAAIIAWAAAQPWSTGRVGMYGASNNGVPQWQALRVGAPALGAIAPHFTASEFAEGWVYEGGAFALAFNLWWTLSNLLPDMVQRADGGGVGDDAGRSAYVEAMAHPDDALRALPLDANAGVRHYAPYYQSWLDHPQPDDPTWAERSLSGRWSEIDVPILHIGGYYNVHLDSTLRNYAACKAAVAPDVFAEHHLILGPWTQWAPALFGDACGPERSFPSLFDMEGLQLRYFAEHLGLPGAPALDLAPVRVFVMGEDVWRDEPAWPLERAVERRLHLHSGGHANTRDGDGVLGFEAPGDEPPDTFVADPRDPVPTIGGAAYLPNPQANAGPRDQVVVEARDDVLVYTSAVLDEAVEVTGPVRIELWVASTAPTTDFTAKLVDVFPDGRAYNLCDGILRTRAGDVGRRDAPELAAEGLTRIEIDMAGTSNLFLAGHRIRLEVASSNFPKFDRNPGNGVAPAKATEADLTAVTQTVAHDRDHPSALLLPIVPR